MRYHQILVEMTYREALAVWNRFGVNANHLGSDQLSTARAAMMKKYHGDIGGSGDAAGLINAAYDVLKKQRRDTYQRQRQPARDPEENAFPQWAMAGYAGGMKSQAQINRNDYTDVNFIKKRMWELSNQSDEEWTLWGFDGTFLRHVVTVYGSSSIFAEMAKAMVVWQTQGANPYPCRAVIVNRRRENAFHVIWADNHDLSKNALPIESDSFNANPSNDSSFCPRLRRLIDGLDAYPDEQAPYGSSGKVLTSNRGRRLDISF